MSPPHVHVHAHVCAPHPHIRYMSIGIVRARPERTYYRTELMSMMETRSLSDSKLPLAELEIEEEIAKKQSHSLKHSASGHPSKPPRAGRSRGGSAALARYSVNDGNKRDSRTGEAIGSKMCQEHPERCNVRCSSAWNNIVIIVGANRTNFC